MGSYVCVICNGKGTEDFSAGEFRDVECPNCGKYLISRTLLTDIKAQNNRFNIAATRSCINGFISAGKPAVISRAEVAAHQLFSA